MAKKRKPTDPLAPIGDSLIAETDRGCVLVGHAYIDELVKFRLHLQFKRNAGEEVANFLLSGYRLGSFWPRVVLARGIGMIDENVYKMLEKLNDLRNSFAHHPGPVKLEIGMVKKILRHHPNFIEPSDSFLGIFTRRAKAMKIDHSFSEARLLLMVTLVELYCSMTKQGIVITGPGEIRLLEDQY